MGEAEVSTKHLGFKECCGKISSNMFISIQGTVDRSRTQQRALTYTGQVGSAGPRSQRAQDTIRTSSSGEGPGLGVPLLIIVLRIQLKC